MWMQLTIVSLNSLLWSANKNLRGQGNDGVGEMGYQRLNGRQGKDFRKEKHKLKNRDFYGGFIGTRNNMIELD